MQTLLIDNYDSFTFNLADAIKQLGVGCTVIRNDEEIFGDLTGDIDCIVLSPGPETPDKAGFLMQVIEQYHRHIPILGICLGHQAIGQFFGADLIKAKIPMHGKPVTVTHTGHPLFHGIKENFSVMCYHSLVLSRLTGTGLKQLAADPDGNPMAILHTDYRCFGVQYHPESILTPSGLKLLANWFRLTRTRDG